MTQIKGAEWRPLKENKTEPLIKATQLIFHSGVTRADSLWGFFQRDDVVVESHLYVDEKGNIEQYIDLDRQADANYKANIRAISVETWDNRDPNDIPWNDAQMRSLVDIAVQVHRLKGVPILRAPAWDKPGMGGHTDFKEWSNVRGKTCPGTVRKPQIAVILSRARSLAAGKVPTQTRTTPATGTKAPAFPLPGDHWFGRPSRDPRNHSGYYSRTDRDRLKIWQAQMRRRGWNINVDGLFSEQCEKVALAFQEEKGLVRDGKVGVATWNAAWTAAVTK